ncbi:MAG: phosphate ABC transporter substrate-binding protein PstS family protein [Propionibacteriales bacterium]|nr:phosphate ABC transporter substrate-binding protein PstS family protein [Propionibacteriales bacterium]
MSVKRIPLRRLAAPAAVALSLTLALAACGSGDDSQASEGGGGGGGGDAELSGEIAIDGSSTVAPLSEPMGELFNQEQSGVNVSVGTSGTGGGFEKFCVGETDISDASREIADEEIQMCEQNGIEFEQLTVANDALSVVVHPDNPVECITVDQLNQIFDPKSTISSWSEIDGLEADFGEDLEIFSPGADSGTFDYFTDAVNGEEGAQRTKGVNIVGENDNATVTGVSGTPGGIGYFGYSFYVENQDKLKALQIENPDTGECVAPEPEATQAGDYAPLGRQLYIYPSAQALQKPEVLEFVNFYITNVNNVAEQVGFIPMTDEQIAEAQAAVDQLAGAGE